MLIYISSQGFSSVLKRIKGFRTVKKRDRTVIKFKGRFRTLDALERKWNAMGTVFERIGTRRRRSRHKIVIFTVIKMHFSRFYLRIFEFLGRVQGCFGKSRSYRRLKKNFATRHNIFKIKKGDKIRLTFPKTGKKIFDFFCKGKS
jgi:ribosomal protein L20A (L18A)